MLPKAEEGSASEREVDSTMEGARTIDDKSSSEIEGLGVISTDGENFV